jgi:hypothetical protein
MWCDFLGAVVLERDDFVDADQLEAAGLVSGGLELKHLDKL